MTQYNKPARVGSMPVANVPRCTICQVDMWYWGEEGIWICDRCQLVKVPRPTESYKIATTWGHGNTWWEYRFWLGDMARNRIIMMSENMIAIDITELINLDMFNMVLESVVREAKIDCGKFERGESKILSFSGNSFLVGTIQLVRAPDDNI